MTSLRPGSLALVLSALAAATDAQLDSFSEADAQTLAWPATIPALAKGRMIAGDVTGDLLPDALLLNGGKPVLVYGPAIYRSVFELDPGQVVVNDIAYLPPDETEVRGAFVAVGPQGAWILSTYDGGSFEATPVPAASWEGATRVLVGDVDGDGASDLVGLSETGALLVLEDLRGGAPVETEIEMPAPVFDLAPLAWNGAGPEAIALLRADGFFVVDGDGDVLDSIPGPVLGGIVSPLSEAGAPGDRCALVFAAGGAQFLLVVDALGFEPPIELGPLGVYAVAAGDVDGDGNDDLVLVHGTSHETAVLHNASASGPATFVASQVEIVDLAPGVTPPPTASAWPALCDFSLDGDLDLLVFVEATGAFAFLENQELAVEAGHAAVTGGGYLFDLDDPHGELSLVFQAPAAVPFTPTHVQVIAWVQLDAQGGGLVAEPQAVDLGRYALSAQGKATSHLLLPETDLDTPNIYHFDVRAVRIVDERGPIASGPPAVHAFTTPMELVEELEAEFGPGVQLRVFITGDGQGPRELDEFELTDRSLAPKEVKTEKIPVIEIPPDPFQ